jgi:hypothetical protein
MIRAAYLLDEAIDDDEVKRTRCAIEGFNIHDCIAAIYRAVGWRAKYFYVALRQCSETMESGRLFCLLSALAKGGNECLTRKRYALNVVLDLVDPEASPSVSASCQAPLPAAVALLSLPPEGDRAGGRAGGGAGGGAGGCDVDGLGGPLGRAEARLRACADRYLDEYKDGAFRAAFMEPVKVYTRASGGGDLEVGNATVHAANAYAAVLLATLGVQLPIQPFLDDDHAVGRRAFLAAARLCPAYQAALDALARPENFGKDAASLPACRGVQLPKTARQPEGFIFDGLRPRALADAAVDPTEPNRARREELAPYLDRCAPRDLPRPRWPHGA